jgi:hypothetical protein
MTQLLSLLNQAFSKQTKSNDLERSMPLKGSQAIKSVQDAFLNLYDAWIEARLAQAKYYKKSSHIE